jgi:hypothetical protein
MRPANDDKQLRVGRKAGYIQPPFTENLIPILPLGINTPSGFAALPGRM